LRKKVDSDLIFIPSARGYTVLVLPLLYEALLASAPLYLSGQEHGKPLCDARQCKNVLGEDNWAVAAGVVVLQNGG
jgi:hypothetical protein